jgi:hypothetical protein
MSGEIVRLRIIGNHILSHSITRQACRRTCFIEWDKMVLDLDLFAGFEDRDAKRKITDKNYRLASGTPRFVVILGLWSTLDNELGPMKLST